VGKDQRLYGKFTLDFPENQKILPLSDAAFRCLVEATLWSRKQETDGWLATRLALAKWSPEVLEELCTNDPEKPSLIPVENGWLIRDYADHQDTKDEIAARRERNRVAGQKGGLAKGKRGAKRTASDLLSETVAEEEEETEEHNPTPKGVGAPRKRRAKPRTRICDDYMPSRPTADKLRADFPDVTDPLLRSLHEDFCLYWQGQGRPMADWDAVWLRWMRKEFAKSKPTTSNGSVVDNKVSEWIDLANKQPHLKAIGG
jgi:hypothetical protein